MGSVVSRASWRKPKLLVNTVPSGNPSTPASAYVAAVPGGRRTVRRLIAPSEYSGVVRLNGTTSLASGATCPLDSSTWHQSASVPGTESSVGTLGVHGWGLLGLEPQAASASTAPTKTPRTDIDIEATS